MDQATLQQATTLNGTIEALTGLVSKLEQILNEHWLITNLTFTAPATGASVPEGTSVQVIIPGQTASDELSQLAANTALSAYQQQLVSAQTAFAAL
jgi:hypothetical protein